MKIDFFGTSQRKAFVLLLECSAIPRHYLFPKYDLSHGFLEAPVVYGIT